MFGGDHCDNANTNGRTRRPSSGRTAPVRQRAIRDSEKASTSKHEVGGLQVYVAMHFDGEIGLSIAVGVTLHEGIVPFGLDDQIACRAVERTGSIEMECLVALRLPVGIDRTQVDLVVFGVAEIHDRVTPTRSHGGLRC